MSTSPQAPRPRRRPPWWPETEPWPPESWRTEAPGWRNESGWGGGPWRHGWGQRRGGFRRPFGCLLIAFALFATGTFTIGIWALAAVVGLVSAPPIVMAGGLIALVVIGMAAFTAARMVRRMAAPIDDLVDAAARIEAGDYSVRVIERGPPQMRSLARAFNGMSTRLGDLDARRRTFLADVVHELRTPLSVIEGQLEAIEDGIYSADAEHLAPIHEQVRTLEKLIDDLRTLALAEAGSLSLDRKPTDLGATVEEFVTGFASQASASGVRLTSEVEPGLPPASLDASRIRQLLGNLITNALRHVPAGGWVKVAVRRARKAEPPGSLVLEVSDNGSGIAPELLPTVFDRFVKDAGSPGSGLGLAIARDLVQAHGGTITADSPNGQGTTIRATLPAS
jgi:two-component system sensor histidine kinase BaeS